MHPHILPPGVWECGPRKEPASPRQAPAGGTPGPEDRRGKSASSAGSWEPPPAPWTRGHFRRGEPRDPAWSLSRLHTPLNARVPSSSNPAARADGRPCPAPGPLRGPRLHAGLRGVTGAARDHAACEWRSQDWTPDLLRPAPIGHWSAAPHTSPKEAGSGAGGAASGDGVPRGQVDTCAPRGVGEVRSESRALHWSGGWAGPPPACRGSLGPHPDSKPNSYGFEPMPCPLHQLLRTGVGVALSGPRASVYPQLDGRRQADVQCVPLSSHGHWIPGQAWALDHWKQLFPI